MVTLVSKSTSVYMVTTVTFVSKSTSVYMVSAITFVSKVTDVYMVTTVTFVIKVACFYMTMTVTCVTIGALVTSYKVPMATKVKIFTGFCGCVNMPEESCSADSFYLVKYCLYELKALNSTCRMIAQRSTADHNMSFMPILCHLCYSTVQDIQIHTYFSLTKHLHVGVDHSCIARTVAT